MAVRRWLLAQAQDCGFCDKPNQSQRTRLNGPPQVVWATRPSQANLFENAAQHVWQKRFYDFNVWTARKRVEKLRYMHRNPVQRGFGGVAGTVALEQLPRLLVWGNREGTGEPVGRAQDGRFERRRVRANPIAAGGADGPLLENREKWRTPISFWSTSQGEHEFYAPRRSVPTGKAGSSLRSE